MVRLPRRQARAGPGDVPEKNQKGFAWSPVLAGVAAALFVTVIGNLDGAIQSLEILLRLFGDCNREVVRRYSWQRESASDVPSE